MDNTTICSFDDIQHLWHSIEKESLQLSIFDTYQWNKLVYDFHCRDTKSCIIASEHNKTILPLVFSSRNRILRHTGHLLSDFISIPAGKPTTCDMMQDVFSYLKKCGLPWECVDLKFISEKSISPAMFMGALHDVGLRGHIYETVDVVACDLNDDVFFNSLFKKKTLKQTMNKLIKRGGYAVCHLMDGNSINEHLPHMFSMHIKQWAQMQLPSLFCDEINKSFYYEMVRTLSEKQQIILSVMTSLNIPVAYVLGFVYNGQYTYYKICYDRQLSAYSPGKVLLLELLKMAKEKGLQEFNFGVGGEDYKYRFSNISYKTYSCKIFKNPVKSALYGFALQCRNLIKGTTLGEQIYLRLKRIFLK